MQTVLGANGQIAEELTHLRPPHPAAVSQLVPEQAPHGVGPAPTSADQVPTSWTESGADNPGPGSARTPERH